MACAGQPGAAGIKASPAEPTSDDTYGYKHS